MPKFIVYARWQMSDYFEVEAETMDEAIEKVYANDDDKYCVDDRGEYVDDSFEIDKKQCEPALT